MSNHISVLKKFDPEEMRNDFPVFNRKVNGKSLVYLDNAATTQKPASVLYTISNYYELHNSNIHRGVHTLSYESTVMYEEAHKKIAKLIGSPTWENIIFTRNATESINMVAYAWGLHNLKKGDEVVITMMEHHSNIVPWQMLRDRNGIVLKYADVTEEGHLDMDSLDGLITEKTKLVSVVHASNVLGTVNPVKEIAEKARHAGARVLVDAAQSLPHIALDVNDIDCDFLAASGHKMLGPTGIGFLYAKKDILENMEPFLYGGDMIEQVTTDKSTWNELPWKFEAGTPNIAGGIGLGAAIDYLKFVGMDKIAEYERELTVFALGKMSEFPWINVYGPKKGERLGVISFNVEGVHPHDVAGVLDEHGIAIRSGHHCAQPLMKRLGMDFAARMSFYIYNTKSDIDLALRAIEKAKSIYG